MVLLAIYILIGLAIFLYYLSHSGQDRSLQITMELGLAIALLATSINYSFSPVFQVALLILIVMLFLQKGWA